MASARRLQVLATQAVPVMVTVIEYKYDMDGIHTGYLYLKSGNTHGESLCCWRSQKTSLTTPWHGGWSEDEAGGIYARFDHLGRDNLKFCDIREIVHAVSMRGFVHSLRLRVHVFTCLPDLCGNVKTAPQMISLNIRSKSMHIEANRNNSLQRCAARTSDVPLTSAVCRFEILEFFGFLVGCTLN